MNVNTEEFRELTEEESKMEQASLIDHLAEKQEILARRLTAFQKEKGKLSPHDHNSQARRAQQEFMRKIKPKEKG